MPDQEIFDLLTQIRDLPREHPKNYHQALEQQRKAIRLQRVALTVGPTVRVRGGFCVPLDLSTNNSVVTVRFGQSFDIPAIMRHFVTGEFGNG